MADRTERLSITRTNAGTTVKLVVVEDGVTVSYTVKTYESAIKAGVAMARTGADKLLAQVRDA